MNVSLHSRLAGYRKQIARQRRTQYVEGIRPKYYTVTLKSRLGVTQGMDSYIIALYVII